MKAKGHLAYDRPEPWGQAAADLMHVEISGQWKKRFGSFSLYLQYLANEKKKTKSSFWRLRRAGRYYNELREKLAKAGTEFPELQDPTVKATPESLELLAKISRVAPLELLKDLEPRTMAGGVTRGALRGIWETYRPVLLGETARGRKVAPRFDEGNLMMQSALAEANTLAPIVQDAPNWIGVDGSVYACRVVHISNNEALKHVSRPAAPDTTVVETTIHYPTDSTLLGDGVRVLTRTMKKITDVAGEVGTRLRNRMRNVQHRLIEIGRASRSKMQLAKRS